MSQHSGATLLAALRAGPPSAYDALAYVGEPGSDARRAALRAEVTQALVGHLLPADRSLVRWLLEQERAQLRASGHGVTETLYALVAALARFGYPEDTLLLWRAREATPETQAGVDVEQLLRAGAEQVRGYLRGLARGEEPAAHEAQAALDWIEAGITAGAADDLPGYFHWADDRFGVRIVGPACRFNGPASCDDDLTG